MHVGLVERFRHTPARGWYVRPPLLHWRDLLDQWCTVHELYCQRVRGDAIYWNIERSNLAALAAAAWRLNWPALEEFPQHRRINRVRVAGRADLFLKSRRGDEYIESKMAWISSRGSVFSVASGISRKLDRACADASDLHLSPSHALRVGVVFAVPYYRRELVKFDQRLLSFFGKLETTQTDAVAWCFPRCAKNLVWREPHEQTHPGVIMLARLAP